MNRKQYLRSLNREIQKLNGVIDLKILHERDYRGEALRHKKLLREIRKEEMQTSLGTFFRFLTPSWF